MKTLIGAFVGITVLSACAGIQSRYHTVEKGDSLKKIAEKYGIAVSELKEKNTDALEEGLHAGLKLYVPFESDPSWNKEYYDREIASDDPPDLQKVGFQWPLRGRISSKFGKRYMRGRGRHFHEGIDIAARKGTPVRAARSGHVVYATNRISGYGNMVIVQHPDKYSTVYAHLTHFKVKKGQFVTRGQMVGTVGRTGRSTGHHLHFEVRNQRRPVDPLNYLYEQYARHP